MNVLILGAGSKNISNFLNSTITTIDIRPNVGASVVWDLNQTPWPFTDDSFDYVLGEHILEHLDDTTKTMEEIYRICRSNAQVEITVPYFRSKWQAIDPTHKKQFMPWTIHNYTPGVKLGRRQFSLYEQYTHSHITNFKLTKFTWNKDIDQTNFQKLLIWISDKNLEFYEDKLAPMFPLECMTWELEVLK